MSEILGKNMSDFRKERGVTQRELGDFLGISSSAIAMWETGKREPDLEMLTRLAEYFAVTTDTLLGITPIATHEFDKNVRSLAREYLSLDTKSQDALMQIVKSMQKKGKEALDE